MLFRALLRVPLLVICIYSVAVSGHPPVPLQAVLSTAPDSGGKSADAVTNEGGWSYFDDELKLNALPSFPLVKPPSTVVSASLTSLSMGGGQIVTWMYGSFTRLGGEPSGMLAVVACEFGQCAFTKARGVLSDGFEGTVTGLTPFCLTGNLVPVACESDVVHRLTLVLGRFDQAVGAPESSKNAVLCESDGECSTFSVPDEWLMSPYWFGGQAYNVRGDMFVWDTAQCSLCTLTLPCIPAARKQTSLLSCNGATPWFSGGEHLVAFTSGIAPNGTACSGHAFSGINASFVLEYSTSTGCWFVGLKLNETFTSLLVDGDDNLIVFMGRREVKNREWSLNIVRRSLRGVWLHTDSYIDVGSGPTLKQALALSTRAGIIAIATTDGILWTASLNNISNWTQQQFSQADSFSTPTRIELTIPTNDSVIVFGVFEHAYDEPTAIDYLSGSKIFNYAVCSVATRNIDTGTVTTTGGYEKGRFGVVCPNGATAFFAMSSASVWFLREDPQPSVPVWEPWPNNSSLRLAGVNPASLVCSPKHRILTSVVLNSTTFELVDIYDGKSIFTWRNDSLKFLNVSNDGFPGSWGISFPVFVKKGLFLVAFEQIGVSLFGIDLHEKSARHLTTANFNSSRFVKWSPYILSDLAVIGADVIAVSILSSRDAAHTMLIQTTLLLFNISSRDVDYTITATGTGLDDGGRNDFLLPLIAPSSDGVYVSAPAQATSWLVNFFNISSKEWQAVGKNCSGENGANQNFLLLNDHLLYTTYDRTGNLRLYWCNTTTGEAWAAESESTQDIGFVMPASLYFLTPVIPSPQAPRHSGSSKMPTIVLAISVALITITFASGLLVTYIHRRKLRRLQELLADVPDVDGATVKLVSPMASFESTMSSLDEERDLFSEDSENDAARPLIEFYDKQASFRKSSVASVPLQRGRLLGRGSFGAVYACKLGSLRGEFAVKVFWTVAPADFSQARDGFLREVAVMRRLRHPNVASLIGWIDESGSTASQNQATPTVGLILEKFDDSLHSVMEKRKRQGSRQSIPWFEYEEVVDFLQQLGNGMAYLHQESVAHRDIKSENVLCDLVGLIDIRRVVLSDFGCSLIAEALGSSTAMTVTGTRDCMAPEVLKPPYNPFAADIWSFGVVAFELVSGERQKDLQGQDRPQWQPYADEHAELRATEWTKVVNLCNACLVIEPTRRPTALDVVTMLN